MLKLNRSTSMGLLAAAGLCTTAVSAYADVSSGDTVILNTVSALIQDSPNGPATKPVARCTGAGVMDAQVSYDNGNGDIFMVWTNSAATKNNNGSYMQGALSVANLSATGLHVTVPTIELPELNGDRPHMRPNAAIGSNFLLDVFASEDNGANNNPQAVAWVFDRAGKMLKIANSTRKDAKPTNLITLSGNNDNQQYGPHSICPLGVNAAGEEGFLIGTQRNNQQAQIMRVNVKVVNGEATVTVPFLKTFVQNAQHNRPQIACPTDGPLGATAVVTSVEANTQPANVGVRAALIDTATGKTLQSKLIAKSDPNNKKYAVQPSAAYISEKVVAIQWQLSGRSTGGNGNGGNGHARDGSNLSMLTTLSIATDGTAFTKLAEISKVASYQRHASAYGSSYGQMGQTMPAAAIISGSPDGMNRGLVQVVPIDPSTGAIGAVDPAKVFEVSKYSDVANLPARAKRNPNDQGRGFINGLHGILNPGYQKPNGFMPEVQSFTLSTVAGLKDAAVSNRDSLFLSLIPATWDPAVQTTPGSVKDPGEVPLGASPTTSTPTVPVSDPGTGGGTPDAPGFNDGTGDQGSSGVTHRPSSSLAGAQSGGCSVSAPGSASSGFGALALIGLGAAFLGIRRKKEQ